ncbi:MAG: stage II sporulation protein M [Chloroflexia bacterium]|nr:stage II sporulation protein M [Chloroflexia bacterium]MDQ3327049.1 stage II sporulation protein M [Chloroflexota bacterium]
MIDRFIDTRKPRWDRLTALLSRVRRGRLSRLTAAEIEEFGALYRETASDLALARRDYPSAPVARYLNGLLSQAHPYVYARRGGNQRSLLRFFTQEFPATVRRNGHLVLLGFLSFFLPAILAYVLIYTTPRASAVLVPDGMESRIAQVQRTGNWADISASESSVAASTIMTNNIRVAVLAFTGGIFLGIPSLLVLALNGLTIGGVAAAAQRGGVGLELWSFVSPHGWIELTVIFIAGGAGMGLGKAVLLPGLLSRRDALVAAAQEAVRLLMGGAALLVVAGTIEGFISPSALPPGAKFAFGVLTAVALFSYLLLSGREGEEDEAAALDLIDR